VPTILLIDDEQSIRYSLTRLFSSRGITVVSCRTGEESFELMKRHAPDIAILDFMLPDTDGVSLLPRLREADPKMPVILITAFGTTDRAIEAMVGGAFDYLEKPFGTDRLLDLAARAVEAGRMMKEAVTISPLVGSSLAMQEIYKRIGQVAPTDVTVLVRGESGTGKELIARAIYHHSRRKGAPFLPVNCAAIPDHLLESELFGHEKGAFTGAYSRRIGKFEQVTGGTIFLDEIGDMSLPTQAKVLRVLQEKEVIRVGGDRRIPVDVRVVTATNKDLEGMISAGTFREDLYYRLNVLTIAIPPLRERKDDLQALVNHFLQTSAGEIGKRPQAVSPAAMERLRGHAWPGNVRELENVVKRAMVVARGATILPEEIRFEEGEEPMPPPAGEMAGDLDALLDRLLASGAAGDRPALAFLEAGLIRRALLRTGGNQVQASKLLKIGRNTLRRKMAEYRIAPHPGNQEPG
jgi:DNA-binding NtrC family response regulator